MSKKKKGKGKKGKVIVSGNGHSILVLARGGYGKSFSLIDLKDPENAAYLNTDNKPLTVNVKFGVSEFITKPKQVLKYLKAINKGKIKNPPHTVVIDTITHLMKMYHTQHIANASNVQDAWAGYATFYNKVLHEVKVGKFNTIIMGHLTEVYDDDGNILEIKVPIQGQIGKIGIETDFTTIVEVVVMKPKNLKSHKNELLNITKEDKEDGIKRVFLTRKFKKFQHSKARSQHNLYERKMLFIDNNVQHVLDRLDNFYS